MNIKYSYVLQDRLPSIKDADTMPRTVHLLLLSSTISPKKIENAESYYSKMCDLPPPESPVHGPVPVMI